jgi:hypothetical protein
MKKYKINDNLNLVVENTKKTFFEIKDIKNAITDIISFLSSNM